MATVLAILALLVALVALGLVLRQSRASTSESGAGSGSADDADEPGDLQALRSEVAALREDLVASLRHLAVVRYDAFEDVGGRLSWTCALLDDSGSGLVLTSIHGRQDTRTYAKGIRDWESPTPLSPEEERAVGHARAGASD